MSVTAPAGFRAAGVAAGIKPSGALDLALVAAGHPCVAAAVFTGNTAAAAPVIVSRRHLADGEGIRALVVNSGYANAATGAAGEAAAEAMCAAVADALGCENHHVLVASTGVIGEPLPVERVIKGIGEAASRLDDHAGAGTSAAAAMMTTDRVVKEHFAHGDGFVVGGMAKGAGMIRPNMATMLAVLTTDAVVDTAGLDAALRDAVDVSFNSLDIDGCESTNDMVAVLASGASGVAAGYDDLVGPLTTVCVELARSIAADAEGAHRVVTLHVEGAADDATARDLGRAITDWDLVRTAFHGGDPNWGRIVAALGASRLPFDLDAVAIAFEDTWVARHGVAVPHDADGLAARLASGDFTVTVVVGEGPGWARILTTDLTAEYVRFNAERS